MELFINKAQLLFIGGNILSNNILSDLEPKSVFNYFEQICSIPHGSRNTKQISDFCVSFAKEHNLKYSPFCGKVGGSPVELTGSIDEIVSSAKECIEKGADGVDLTAYRYADGDPIELTKAIVDAIGADKVCIAGSVGNEERMNQMKDAGVAEYTMGSALFNANFVEGGTFRENLEYVLNYLRK